MINQPLLSICIPTYNRPNELRQTLSILLRQSENLPEKFKDKIQYIVSDNHSDYNILALIAEFAESLAIQSIVQHYNIGPTLNFEYCFRHAKGKHVLILSDDDHLVDGGLYKILACLERYEPDVVFLPFTPQPKLNAEASCTQFLERNQFLERVGYLPTLISSCIFKRELIQDVLGHYLETNMHHYNYFLHAIERGRRFEIFSQQMLSCPYEHNKGGYDWFAVFGEQFFRIVDEFEASRTNRSVLREIQRKMLVERIIPIFLNRRIHGYTINQESHEDSLRHIFLIVWKRCRGFAAFWLVFLPIFLLPRFALEALKKIYLRLRLVITSSH
jgi:abequosyltransferase